MELFIEIFFDNNYYDENLDYIHVSDLTLSYEWIQAL